MLKCIVMKNNIPWLGNIKIYELLLAGIIVIFSASLVSYFVYTHIINQPQAIQVSGSSHKVWPQICSGTGGYCLKYPSGWTAKAQMSSGVNGNVFISKSNTTVAYLPSYKPAPTIQPIDISIVRIKRTKDASLKAVQLIEELSVNNQHVYKARSFVMPASNADGFPMVEGQNMAGKTIPAWNLISNNLHPKYINQVIAMEPVGGTDFTSWQAADNWLNTTGPRTALQIESSIFANPR